MAKKGTFTKVFLILGALLLVAGLAVFIAGMSAAGWDFSRLSTVRYDVRAYEAEGAVTSVHVEYSNAGIAVKYSETAETVHIDYPVQLNERGEEAAAVEISEKDGSLAIVESVEWEKNFFQWSLGASPAVNIVLPAGQNIALDLYAQNGSISLEAGGEALPSLSLRSDNGKISVSGEMAVGGTASFQTDNGDIELIGALSAKEITASAGFGNISMRGGTIDAQEIVLTSGVGNIEATDSAFAGAQGDYTVHVSAELGEANVSDSSGGSRKLTLRTDMGDIRVAFER